MARLSARLLRQLLSFSSRSKPLGLAVWALPVALALLVVAGVEHAPSRPEAVIGTREVDSGHEVFEIDASVVGLRWSGDNGPDSALIRVSEDGRNWGQWTPIHQPEDHGPDRGSSEDAAGLNVSEAVYVGDAAWVELSVDGAGDGLELVYVDTSGRSLPLWDRFTNAIGSFRVGGSNPAYALPDQPAIQPRSAWGGDQCVAADPPEYAYTRRVQVMFVHHTVHSASANSYTEADVPNLLYAICNFHVAGNGWSDIAYNVLIDKFGVTWEGRGGSLTEGVIGAHTGGFNTHSTGVAFIGEYGSTAPSQAAQDAFVAYATWKLDVHHVDPMTAPFVTSLGSSRYSAGTVVQLRAVSGHKDASTTSCPGDQLYALIDSLRGQIAVSGGTKIFGGWPMADPIQGSQSVGYTAAVFPFRFTEPMDWTITISAATGASLLTETGSGTSGSITWNGSSGGAAQPFGLYTVSLDAVPVSGAEVPRPARFLFQLGNFNPPFSDDEGSPHEADIAIIYDAGITTGCTSELFCPKNSVERWQMALFLTRLYSSAGLGLPPGASPFVDLGGYSPEAQLAIGQLAELGITSGVAPDLFEPSGVVSRWQMALFITRQLGAMGLVLPDGSDQGFVDLGSYPPETITAINQLSQLGVALGVGNNSYAPANPVTREQMASFLARSMAILAPVSP